MNWSDIQLNTKLYSSNFHYNLLNGIIENIYYIICVAAIY